MSAWIVAAAVSLLFAVGLATAPMATAATCDNATLRVQSNSTALPDCRAYEMVSSPYKQGFPVMAGFFTDDGVVSYRSLGAFAGNAIANPSNLYHAERSAEGWKTSSLDPPGSIFETSLDTNATAVFAESSDLRWAIWRMYRRDTETEADLGFWLRGPDGVFTRVGGGAFPSAASAGDLSHLVMGTNEYVGTGNNGPPRPAAIDNNGLGVANCFREISHDGRVLVYGAGGCAGADSQLWARVGGTASVLVSRSECTRPSGDPNGACNAASGVVYEDAADGSRVFFTTSQQLVNGDIDQTNDLYACDIPAGEPAPVGAANPCDTLTQVSGAATGAQVRRVVKVSEDGSRVYFVAQGVLGDSLSPGDVGPRAGADNLYLWERDDAHPAGQTRYVARLAHAENLDPLLNPAPGDDLTSGEIQPQITRDGRYLLFTTANRLVTSGAGADTDEARDLYQYDAVTHTLVRVSTSITGGGGNTAGFDASIPVNASAMSDDGSTVVFETAEALSVSDTDGVTDVYSWRDGQVSLISADGGAAMGVSPSGRDIFFYTSAQVLAADGDAHTDIYTARLGGGFTRPEPAPCSGDSCQGLASGTPGLAGPRSGLSGDSDPDDAGAVLSLRAVTAGQRRRLAATGKLSLTVKANTAGRVTATARAKIGGRSVTVGSARRTMARPGSVAVTLKLSRKARRQLAARGRLTIKVSVSHSKAVKGRSVTLRLTGARAKSSVGGRS